MENRTHFVKKYRFLIQTLISILIYFELIIIDDVTQSTLKDVLIIGLQVLQVTF